MVEIYDQFTQEMLHPVSGGFFYDLMRVLCEPVFNYLSERQFRESQVILESRVKEFFLYGERAEKIPPDTWYELHFSPHYRKLDFRIKFPSWYERMVSYHEPWALKEGYRRLWKEAEGGEDEAFKELLVLLRRDNDFNGAHELFGLAHQTLTTWPHDKVAFELYEFAHGARWEKYQEVVEKLRFTRKTWPHPFC